MDKETADRLTYFIAELNNLRDDRRVLQRLPIMEADPDAPLCINCIHCEQRGFLFYCPLFELPEDGWVAGYYGFVYYYRKGHNPRTYYEVPMREDDCPEFEPLILTVRRDEDK